MKNIEEINEKLKELSDRKNEASMKKDYLGSFRVSSKSRIGFEGNGGCEKKAEKI